VLFVFNSSFASIAFFFVLLLFLFLFFVTFNYSASFLFSSFFLLSKPSKRNLLPRHASSPRYVDGAAVLGQGVKEAHLGLNGHAKSDWDYDLVAIVHPDVVKARAPLKVL
jgi:hypothetical protein